jgi:uncharacterized protein
MKAEPEISREVIETIERAALSFVASTNVDGSANIAPIASLAVHDGIVGFVNIAASTTIANLRRDPRVSIAVVDFLRRRGFRLRGTAHLHGPGTDLFARGAERIWFAHGRQYPVHDIVSVSLEAVSELISPAYRFGGMSAEELEAAFLLRYGAQRIPGRSR